MHLDVACALGFVFSSFGGGGGWQAKPLDSATHLQILRDSQNPFSRDRIAVTAAGASGLHSDCMKDRAGWCGAGRCGAGANSTGSWLLTATKSTDRSGRLHTVFFDITAFTS